MTKLLLIAAAALALVSSARADVLSCTESGGSFTCGYVRGSGTSGARIIQVDPLAEGKVNPAWEAAWLAYCQPVGEVDQYGVTRLSYAHKGCEFGATGPATVNTPFRP